MKLDAQHALHRLAGHDHGTLSTLHPERGIDSVPAVYALDGDSFLGIPIDTIKPKKSTNLQRERNLDGDRRATLLVDQWDASDWSRLWWVRVRLERIDADAAHEARLADLLAQRYVQYRDKPFDHVMVFAIRSITGWSAT